MPKRKESNLMKTIPLTKGYVAMVDDEDYEMLVGRRWYAHRSRNVLYASHTTPHIDGKQDTIKMHHLILHTPKGMQIDHIDGNGLNNQKNNLRVVTNRINQMNRNWDRKSQYPGITWEPRRKHWVAQAQINGKHIHIGSYPTEELAHQAYLVRVMPIEESIKERLV
jgi:hypothetical protein